MKISLVVPVFNESETIAIFYNTVVETPFSKKYDLEILFVNDGSADNTESIILDLISRDKRVSLVSFSRNFGKEPALFAGIEHATGDIVIPIDVDLQDPLEVIERMLEKFEAGSEVVLAKRVDRGSDSWLKKKTAQYFYKIYNKTSNPKIEENVGDFRLMTRKVVDEVIKMGERNLFMKGILSWPGFKTEIVTYSRAERSAGTTKFNGWKLWNLAVEGITSFSTLPLRIWTYAGVFIASTSILYAIVLIIKKILWGNPVPGYPSIMVAILFLGGIQLIGIGVLGEYLGRIYVEVKNRPRYVVKGTYGSIKK